MVITEQNHDYVRTEFSDADDNKAFLEDIKDHSLHSIDVEKGRSGELRSYGSVRGMGPLSPLKRVEANKGTWYAKESQAEATLRNRIVP